MALAVTRTTAALTAISTAFATRATPVFAAATTEATTAAAFATLAVAARKLPALTAGATLASTVSVFTRRRCRLATTTRRTAEGASVPIWGAAAITPRTLSVVVLAPTGRRGLFLSPLRAEAETLQLAQVEFVEIRRRILLGSVVVHFREKRV